MAFKKNLYQIFFGRKNGRAQFFETYFGVVVKHRKSLNIYQCEVSQDIWIIFSVWGGKKIANSDQTKFRFAFQLDQNIFLLL